MKRMIRTAVVSTAIFLLSSTSAFAGQWTADNIGRRYQNDDGTYVVSEWLSDNGKWYYLNETGYMAANTWVGNFYVGADGAMLTNTTTPDGYQVGADGAWIQTSGVFRTPYADLILQFPDYLDSVNAEIRITSVADLIDHGTYYEIPGQSIRYWYQGEWSVEDFDFYYGSLYFYKTLPTDGEYRRYASMADAIVNHYPEYDGKYTFTLFDPDENGYFTRIYVGGVN